ncbi:MAG: hypothetical protein LRS49_00040 [Desulfurococcales archaeon]|nr:hypothetical protein [Desulfurococcales archaeon]
MVRRGHSTRRALSPLVSSVVLISAAVIGGVIVYNYFQSNVNAIAAATGSLQVSADYTYLNETAKIVYLEVMNTYKKPVTITGAQAITGSGNKINLTISNVTIDSSSKGTIIVTVPADAKIIYLLYTVDGKTLYSSPIQVR